MVQLAYTPQWFYDKDIVIDLVGFLVVLLIAFFSFRYYRINRRNSSYLYLSVSFAFLALSFLAKILTNFTIYHNIIQTAQIGGIVLTYTQVQSSNVLFVLGFFLYRLLTLLGIYLLYIIYQRRQPVAVVLLVMYLLLISTIFSRSAYYVFHITAFVLLGMVVFELFARYRSTRNALTRWLASSFVVIALSQLLFIFMDVDDSFYVLAEVVQLIGYAALLVTFLRVLRLGKKG